MDNTIECLSAERHGSIVLVFARDVNTQRSMAVPFDLRCWNNLADGNTGLTFPFLAELHQTDNGPIIEIL